MSQSFVSIRRRLARAVAVAIGVALCLTAGWQLTARAQSNPPAGTWVALTNQPPVAVNNCLQLTDGRVMCQQAYSRNWYALTPNSGGSYLNGTWSALASMQTGYAPLYYASAVLPDGRVIIEGGEYECSSGNCSAKWQTQGSIYNPASNAWTAVSPPSGWTTIGDAMGIVVANGTFMLQDCCSGKNAFFNPTSLGWSAAGGSQTDGYNDEEGWVLLPDGTILNVEVWASNKLATSRYNPTTGVWSSAGSTVSALVDNSAHSNGTDTSYELGPGLLRPDGTVFWLGAAPEPTSTGHTGIYNTATNTWSAGPNIPNHDGANDSPAAVLPNGNVLMQLAPAGSTNVFGTPSRFYEFDGTSITQVGNPSNCGSTCNFASYIGGMLVLPTGEILLTEQSSHVEIYRPSGSASSAWLPTISSVPSAMKPGATYTITGTQFNGLGAGAAYGDDMQAATNYPLVRITNRATGHVSYAKTHDHSTMAVATGSASVNTLFDVPSGIEVGSSDIEVVANGIASAKTAVTITSGPIITLQPVDTTVRTGGTTSFTVAADGSPTFQWQVSTDGGTTFSDLANNSTYSGVTTTTLTITAAPASLSNNRYRAVATNSAGSATSNAAKLSVVNFTIDGDLDGDAKGDLVWRNTQSGDVALWQMNGATVTKGPLIAAGVPQAWQIAGIGDLDGDAKADLIWRNTQSGDVAAWIMNGQTVMSGPVIAAGVPLVWQIAGIGDLDGDTKSDIVWRNTQSGDVAVWLMNGATVKSGPVIAAGVPLVWQIAKVGDLDGDSKADIVWRNTQSGDVAVWLMNGATVKSGPVIAAGVSVAWQIVGIGDLDGDGKADLIWRQTQNGDTATWLMNGATVTQEPVIACCVPLSWQIATIRDVDGDGKVDLIWRNTTSGDVAAWLMNGVTVKQQPIVASGVPLAWQIQK